MLQVIRLDKKVECAACGSRSIEKRDFEYTASGRMLLKEKCLFCDREAGKLCSQNVTVPDRASFQLSTPGSVFST